MRALLRASQRARSAPPRRPEPQFCETIISKGETYVKPQYRPGEDPDDLGVDNGAIIVKDVTAAWRQGILDNGEILRHSHAAHTAISTAQRLMQYEQQQRDEAVSSIPPPMEGYTGHAHARRYEAGEERMSMAQRTARRRREATLRRFGASPHAEAFLAAAALPAPTAKPMRKYGWAAWPPEGL